MNLPTHQFEALLAQSEAQHIVRHVEFIYAVLAQRNIHPLSEESAQVIQPARARGISCYIERSGLCDKCQNTRQAIQSMVEMFQRAPAVLDSPRGIIEIKCSQTRLTIVAAV